MQIKKKPRILKKPLETGKVYQTRMQTKDEFLLTRIQTNKHGEVTQLWGIYQKHPDLGECPLGAGRLQEETYQEGWVDCCPHCGKEIEI